MAESKTADRSKMGSRSRPRTSNLRATIQKDKENMARTQDALSGIKDIWTQIIEETGGDEKGDIDIDPTAIFVGPRQSGKSTLLQSFINKDKDDVPRPTAALDYQSARVASDTQPEKDSTLFHFWEIGGGRAMSRLIEICLKPETLENALIVLVLDLSKPWRVLEDLQFWLKVVREQMMACLKGHPRLPRFAQKARARFNMVSAAADQKEHKDVEKVELSPVPLWFVCTKYDVLKNKDAEQLKVMAKTLRCIAHANGASLMYTSTKTKTTIQAFRIRLKAMLMQQAWPKGLVTEHTKELLIQAGADSFEKVGEPPAQYGSARNLLAGWVNAFSASFHKEEEDEDDEVDFNQPLTLTPEPVIDNAVAQKNEELKRIRRESALKQRMDADNERKR
eukprot:TRINITY_DN4162_c0_g1_i1.p1 TRINITY_DN4162_c0_g1~~TRINITY_DN4162_c0_g1_i1.p1  ORF type:complete len:393 (+),score=75.63 TRINITY_DN4162_c0_g1_i1:54-1232(+)